MEYKFRGKGIASNEWYYGDLIIDEGRYYICLQVNDHIKRDDYEVYMIEVIPETVGQYTGLKDKNGKEIYDGDILKIVDTEYGWIYIANVEFVEGSFVLNMKKGEFKGELLGVDCWEEEEKEVIGNTTDNLELLKEE